MFPACPGLAREESFRRLEEMKGLALAVQIPKLGPHTPAIDEIKEDKEKILLRLTVCSHTDGARPAFAGCSRAKPALGDTPGRSSQGVGTHRAPGTRFLAAQ